MKEQPMEQPKTAQEFIISKQVDISPYIPLYDDNTLEQVVQVNVALQALAMKEKEVLDKVVEVLEKKMIKPENLDSVITYNMGLKSSIEIIKNLIK